MAATAVLAKVRSHGRVAALRLARPAGPLVGHGRMAVTPTPGNVVVAVRHAATGGSLDSAAGKSAGLASRLLGWFTGGGRDDTEKAASSADQAQATAAAQTEEQIPDRDLLFEEYVRIRTDTMPSLGKASMALLGAAAAASGQANTQVKAETVAKLAAVISSAEKADVAKMTPGQLQRLANAAALPMSDVIKVMQEYGMARLLHQEIRIWKREGRPLPKTPSAFQEFLTSVMNRAKQQQATFTKGKQKIRGSDPCPCGSGRKYGRCHGA